AQKIGAQIVAVVPFMAARTGEIELPVAGVIEPLTLLEPRRHRSVDARAYRHASRLEAHERRHRRQFCRAEFPRLGLPVLPAANVDLLLQVDGLVQRLAPLRRGGADALHARRGVLMTAGAGFAGRAVGLSPQLLALLNGEKSRIVEIVILNRLGLPGAEPVSR